MKAIDLYKTALIMAGADADEEFIITGKGVADELFYINKVLADLKIRPIDSLDQELNISIYTADALSAGIAYYISLRASDKERAAFLCDLYNAKRASALSNITRIKYSSVFRN